MLERRVGWQASMALVALIVGAVVLIAAPAAFGAKPIRTVFHPEPILIPAGFGCEFDVEEVPSADTRAVITEFSDGRTVIQGKSDPTLTNLETGDVFLQKTRVKVTDVYDPVANDVLEEISGRIFVGFFPGDQGPFGEVGATGAVYSVIGHQRLTYDLDTDVITSYSLEGQAIDICAALSD